MKKRTLVIIGILVVAISILFSSNNQVDDELVGSTISVHAVYHDGMVEISYDDKTNQTISITLEVIGLNPSFQKKFNSSSFVESVPLTNPPQYGWSVMPVTFLIDHQKFGTIQIKTEIVPLGESPAKVIYSRP